MLEDSAILRRSLLVSLTFLIMGCQCQRANSSVLYEPASFGGLTGIAKQTRDERIMELNLKLVIKAILTAFYFFEDYIFHELLN